MFGGGIAAFGGGAAVVTKIPTTVAIASEAKAINSAVDIASNCMKADGAAL